MLVTLQLLLSISTASKLELQLLTGTQFGTISTGMTEQEKFAALFPGDTTSQLAEKRYVVKKKKPNH